MLNNIPLIVAGLDGTYQMEVFGTDSKTTNVLDIIPMCDEIVKLNAVCKHCMDERDTMVLAAYTNKKSNSNNNETKCIGGTETYDPVCFNCHAITNTRSS